MASFQAMAQNLRRGYEEDYGYQSGWPISGPRFETGTSGTQSRNVNHSTETHAKTSCYGANMQSHETWVKTRGSKWDHCDKQTN